MNDPEVLRKRAKRLGQVQARDARLAERKLARETQDAAELAAREARETTEKAEREEREACERAEQASRKVALEQEKKTERDARYAARKVRASSSAKVAHSASLVSDNAGLSLERQQPSVTSGTPSHRSFRTVLPTWLCRPQADPAPGSGQDPEQDGICCSSMSSSLFSPMGSVGSRVRSWGCGNVPGTSSVIFSGVCAPNRAFCCCSVPFLLKARGVRGVKNASFFNIWPWTGHGAVW